MNIGKPTLLPKFGSHKKAIKNRYRCTCFRLYSKGKLSCSIELIF